MGRTATPSSSCFDMMSSSFFDISIVTHGGSVCKRLLSVKNADHGLSFLEDNEKCRREITEFFNNL